MKNRGGGETMEEPPPQGNPAEEGRGTCSPRAGEAPPGRWNPPMAHGWQQPPALRPELYAGPVSPCAPSLTCTVVEFAAAGLVATPTSGLLPEPAVFVHAVPVQ